VLASGNQSRGHTTDAVLSNKRRQLRGKGISLPGDRCESKSWALGSGMHLFRQAERESLDRWTNSRTPCPSRGVLIVKKPLSKREKAQRKLKGLLAVKANTLMLKDLPFFHVLNRWSPRRSGWINASSVDHPSRPAKVSNPKVYHGLQVSSTATILPPWNGSVRPFMYALERQGFCRKHPRMSVPDSFRITSREVFNALLPSYMKGKDWFVSRPAVNCTRTQKRCFWWLLNVVKKCPKVLRTGVITVDDRRIFGISRKLGHRKVAFGMVMKELSRKVSIDGPLKVVLAEHQRKRSKKDAAHERSLPKKPG